MKLASHRIVRVALITLIGYFAAFTAACWICDMFFTSAFGLVGFWLGVFPVSGEVLTPVVYIASLFVLRWNR